MAQTGDLLRLYKKAYATYCGLDPRDKCDSLMKLRVLSRVVHKFVPCHTVNGREYFVNLDSNRIEVMPALELDGDIDEDWEVNSISAALLISSWSMA